MDAATEQFVRTRARECCEYCHIPQRADPVEFEFDHIIPRKHRADDPENRRAGLLRVQSAKRTDVAGIDPETEQVVRLFHPRRDSWVEHFEWSGATLVGLTAIGRTTIEVLEINLPHRIALRKALIAEQRFTID